MAETGAASSHQPRNNMNVGDGIAAVESQMRAGVRVCLGNDGLAPTMWREAEAAYLLQKIAHRDARRLPPDQLLEMAVYNGEVLMRDRELLTVDEQDVKARCREAAPAFWERYEAGVPDGPILG